MIVGSGLLPYAEGSSWVITPGIRKPLISVGNVHAQWEYVKLCMHVCISMLCNVASLPSKIQEAEVVWLVSAGQHQRANRGKSPSVKGYVRSPSIIAPCSDVSTFNSAATIICHTSRIVTSAYECSTVVSRNTASWSTRRWLLMCMTDRGRPFCALTASDCCVLTVHHHPKEYSCRAPFNYKKNSNQNDSGTHRILITQFSNGRPWPPLGFSQLQQVRRIIYSCLQAIFD